MTSQCGVCICVCFATAFLCLNEHVRFSLRGIPVRVSQRHIIGLNAPLTHVRAAGDHLQWAVQRGVLPEQDEGSSRHRNLLRRQGAAMYHVDVFICVL